MIAPLAIQAQVTGGTTAAVTLTVAAFLGIVVIAGIIAACVAVAFRWYVRERVPTGLALLAGLAAVAVSLSTTTLLAEEIAPGGPSIELVTALVHVVVFLTSGVSAYAGSRFGDRLGVNLYAAGGADNVDADVSEIVQTVGRVTTVQLPEEIADIVGYDPVAEATKETLAGRRFLFPRRLTKSELRERLVSRLKTDYGVGHVDVEFGDDGSISFLAVGSRAAGIGPTLPPATNAVAIRADPAHAASAGDLVQVWETGPMRRVLTGELRGVAGDVVTVAIDAADTPKLDPTERYKLVTLPVQDRPDREFASLLRSADETLATVTVEAGSDLDGVTLDALGVTVAAITREDEAPEPLPARSRTLQAGDVLYAIATPELLRKLDEAAQALGSGGSSVVSSSPARPADAAPEPAAPETPAAEPEPQRAEPTAGSSNAEQQPAESDDPSGEAPEPASDTSAPSSDDATPVSDAPDSEPDQPSTGATESDRSTDEAVPEGDAFPDTADLPGMDQDAEMPDLTDDSSDAAGDDDRGDAVEERPDDAGDTEPAPSDGLAAETETDDASEGDFESLGAAADDDLGDEDLLDDLDADDSVADAGIDDPLDDEAGDSFDDLAADDLLDAESDDPLDDGGFDEGEFDDGLDDAAVGDAAPENRAEDDGDEDESVPFTPLDVGDEDPLSDPLTEGSDGDDESEREN